MFSSRSMSNSTEYGSVAEQQSRDEFQGSFVVSGATGRAPDGPKHGVAYFLFFFGPVLVPEPSPGLGVELPVKKL